MRHVMQEVSSISTEPWTRNVQAPPIAIDVGSEEVNQLLWPIQSIALDLNKFPAQVLVELQYVASQELADKQKDINDQYLHS